MVVLKNWKFYVVATFRFHYALCKKCPETARDKVEYLENVTTLIKDYKRIRFWKKIVLRGKGNKNVVAV